MLEFPLILVLPLVLVFCTWITTVLTQKIYHHLAGSPSSPRLGGLTLYVSTLAMLFAVKWTVPIFDEFPVYGRDQVLGSTWFIESLDRSCMWLLILVPAWACGFAEDLRRDLSIAARFWATIFAGLLFSILTNDRIVRLALFDLPNLDTLGAVGWILSVLLTTIALAGYTHAVNIIDGLHGLASGASVIILLSLAALSLRYEDFLLAHMALCFCGVAGGFFLVNYPRGRIFLGDSGAYFCGFLTAAVAIALPARHHEVSPWASLLICGYPVIEVGFSSLRRIRSKRRSPIHADHLHLHSLLYRRWVRNNPQTTPFILLAVATLAVLAVTFAENHRVLIFFFLISCLSYSLLYRHLTRPFRRKAKR